MSNIHKSQPSLTLLKSIYVITFKILLDWVVVTLYLNRAKPHHYRIDQVYVKKMI